MLLISLRRQVWNHPLRFVAVGCVPVSRAQRRFSRRALGQQPTLTQASSHRMNNFQISSPNFRAPILGSDRPRVAAMCHTERYESQKTFNLLPKLYP
jgi:hypothetical protein